MILDTPGRQWLNSLIARLYRAKSSEALLCDDSTADRSQALNRTLVRMGLQRTVLYPVRHSGPSIDILNKTRNLAAVKRRWCWATDASARRYEKASRTTSLSNNFTGEPKAYLMKCQKSLPRAMGMLEAVVDFAGVYGGRTGRRL